TMKRSMARQAEAARDRRARVINADAELQASKKLAQAASVMGSQPAALQLRLLQTVTAVAAEKNSTLVLPFPVELLRFLERAAQNPPAALHRGPDGAGSATDAEAPKAGPEFDAGLEPGLAPELETDDPVDPVNPVGPVDPTDLVEPSHPAD